MNIPLWISIIKGTYSVTNKLSGIKSRSDAKLSINELNFDDPQDAQEIKTGYSISGNYKFVEGVSGKSLKLDGFTPQVRSNNLNTQKMGEAFSVEAYIALATYPWNWSPVLCQNDKERSVFYFGIGMRG